MGYKEFDIKIPVYCSEDELRNSITRKAGVNKFSYQIIKKSLDARNKKKIGWLYRIGILSDELSFGICPIKPTLIPDYKKQNKQIVIAGTGPAGLFSALFLAYSGFKVTLLERGNKVEERKESIHKFETTGKFDPKNNYAFGEGGAGTFSDGKLTSRTKNISRERNFIFGQLIEAGAPEEISYMTHPHLGTDNLYIITQSIRQKLYNLGCEIKYNCQLEELKIKNNKVIKAVTPKGEFDTDFLMIATGHSAYETYRMLLHKGVIFQTKNFALGFRAEHQQEMINKAQWGVACLPGIKSAEYRLTAQTGNNTSVYSFCMCPGGMVVPATPYAHTNIVNGMSYYERNSSWANAAIVAGVSFDRIFGRSVSAIEALEWLEKLESSFYQHTKGYAAPAATISGFLQNKSFSTLPASSYPFPLLESDFSELLPEILIAPLKEGLKNFCRKLKGYETGIIIGLESKTSSPIQVRRDPVRMNATFENLYVIGEGSGWAGGIISSAADGLKTCQQILAYSN